MNINLLDEHGRPADASRTRWVIISDDGKNILDDPVRRCAYWSYTKEGAMTTKKIIEKDFKRLVHIVPLETAVKTIAKNRYGVDIKPPLTLDNIKRQLTKVIIEGTK